MTETEILNAPFDMERHKEHFCNYLEVVNNPARSEESDGAWMENFICSKSKPD